MIEMVNVKFFVVCGVVAVLFASLGFYVQPMIFRLEEAAGMGYGAYTFFSTLQLTILTDKTYYSVSPREPVKIIAVLTNIYSKPVTVTFHSETKFDYAIDGHKNIMYFRNKYIYFLLTRSEYWQEWTGDFENVEATWGDPFSYPYDYEETVITVTLRPGEGISQEFIWAQKVYWDDPLSISYPPKGAAFEAYVWVTHFEFEVEGNFYIVEEPIMGSAAETRDYKYKAGVVVTFY